MLIYALIFNLSTHEIEGNQMKKSRNNGIFATTSPKVNEKLRDRLNEESEKFEDGKAGVIREALTEYFFKEPVEITIPDEEIRSERTYTITALVDLDVAHTINTFANKKDVRTEDVAGSIIHDFVSGHWKSKQIDGNSELVQVQVIESDIPEIDKLFQVEPDDIAYEDFLTDLLRAGILAKKSEKSTGKLPSNYLNLSDNPEKSEIEEESRVSTDFLKIRLSEISDVDVRESLQNTGFNEDRYMTELKESRTRAKFGELLISENKSLTEKLESLEIQVKQTMGIGAEFNEFRVNVVKLIDNFEKYCNRSIIGKLKGYTKEELINSFPEKFRKYLI